MNKERFHNELAMRLGYELIVNDKRIIISVEDSDDPWVTLEVQGHGDIKFKASNQSEDIDYTAWAGMYDNIQEIADAVHQAYVISVNSKF